MLTSTPKWFSFSIYSASVALNFGNAQSSEPLLQVTLDKDFVDVNPLDLNDSDNVPDELPVPGIFSKNECNFSKISIQLNKRKKLIRLERGYADHCLKSGQYILRMHPLGDISNRKIFDRFHLHMLFG